MSTIDDLQRLHEAATHSDLRFHDWVERVDKSWPAIHRVLVAARAWDEAPANSIAKLTLAEELSRELRALDDKEQRT